MKFRLYKYRTLDSWKDYIRLSDIIQNQQLWMSDPVFFNDPHEIRTQELGDGKWFDLSCSTEGEQDTMWGYYSNGYTGVVIEFEYDTDSEDDMRLYKIRYYSEEDNPSGGFAFEHYRPISSGCIYKAKQWNHENEYRIVKKARVGDGENGCPCPVKVTGVIFGHKTGAGKNEELKRRLKEKVLSSGNVRSITIPEFRQVTYNATPYKSYTDWTEQIVEHDRFWMRPNDRFANSIQADGQEWWDILDLRFDSTIGSSKALLISENIVDIRPYHSIPEETTWRDCSLREWLNTEYLDGLPQGLQERVIETKNWLAGIPTSDPEDAEFMTRDKIFLLSRDEASFFFEDAEHRRALYDDSWWLREQGAGSIAADLVSRNGSFIEDIWLSIKKVWWCRRRYTADYPEAGVRPALWLDLQEHSEEVSHEEDKTYYLTIPEIGKKILDCDRTRNVLSSILAEFTDDYHNRGTSVEQSLRTWITRNDEADEQYRRQALGQDPKWQGPQNLSDDDTTSLPMKELEEKIRDCKEAREVLKKLLEEYTDNYHNRGTSVESSLVQMLKENDEIDMGYRQQARTIDPHWQGLRPTVS